MLTLWQVHKIAALLASLELWRSWFIHSAIQQLTYTRIGIITTSIPCWYNRS
jgi:hypothetical protein